MQASLVSISEHRDVHGGPTGSILAAEYGDESHRVGTRCCMCPTPKLNMSSQVLFAEQQTREVRYRGKGRPLALACLPVSQGCPGVGPTASNGVLPGALQGTDPLTH